MRFRFLCDRMGLYQGKGIMKNKYIKMLLLNIIIIAMVVLCYSEGFLNLRPSDDSIFRAGMSIFTGFAAVVAFFYGNYYFLSRGDERFFVSNGELSDISQARQLLASFHGGRYFGKMADTATEQLRRLERTMDRADKAIALKFERGSMAYDRYSSTISSAREAALSNCIGMANRMQLFDESEYARLKAFQGDRINDEIQKKQADLYRQNIERIESAVSANEELILALDTMSLELAGEASKEEAPKDAALLDEIKKLTDQVRLYT